MIFIKIDGADQHLFQWDKGQRLIIYDVDDTYCAEFAFFGDKKCTPSDIYDDGGVSYCDIPDGVLTRCGQLICYLRKINEDKEETVKYAKFSVKPRPRPDDYVDPDEILVWHSLEDRIKAIEEIDLSAFATEEYVNDIVSGIDLSGSLLVTVDVSTMTASHSKTEIINASNSGRLVYADVSDQMFMLKNAANASFTEVSYFAGSKIDMTSFYIDDNKTVHLNVSDTYSLLPSYSSSDYGKYPIARENGIKWESPPEVPANLSLGIAGATLGQIARITAVDEAGVPTAWAPVDMPDSMSIGMELGVIDPVADENNALFTDENGAIYSL